VTLYYSGDGQFYSARLGRSLSLAGALDTGCAGGAGPRRGHHGHHHGGGGRGAAINGRTDAATMADVAVEGGGGYSSGEGGGTPSSLPTILEDLYNFFNGLFGGGGGSSLPPNYFVFQARLERAGRHPLYDQILRIARQLILTQASPVWELFSGPGTIPPNVPPLLRADYSGQIIPAQEIIPYEGGGELTVPGEPEPPFSLSPRSVTYGRCLDAAEHPTLWANLCRDMPNSQTMVGCWKVLLESVQERRGFCADLFET